ncbi:uncharacterized protein METZ01_LOCUS139724 [marine metagenome]|uniref:Uncharacterized protein n=1 Tax=marine metagenome TaxID=408172 RepID=A0A381ZCC0_9ZZZZ
MRIVPSNPYGMIFLYLLDLSASENLILALIGL